jgi:hypothetical protein
MNNTDIPEHLIKIRDRKRKLLIKRLTGLPIEDMVRAVSRIDVTTCLACNELFVSDDKTKIRRCNKCGPGTHNSFEMDINNNLSQRTRRPPGI